MGKENEKYSPEIQLFQSIIEESADDIYVIEKSNFRLLYANELKNPLWSDQKRIGKTCYQLLNGRTEPCEFCSLLHEDQTLETMIFENKGRFYSTRFHEMDWNGIPAYVKYVRDVTEEVESQKEKERLEQYFQTAVKYLPGGMAIIHHEVGGKITPEYLSDGFAEMLEMSKEQVLQMYRDNALAGVHPEDREYVKEKLNQCILENREKYELQYRLQKGTGEYLWIHAKFSVIQCDAGSARIYADYHDITAEKRMQEQLRQQYKEQIHQHYLLAGPDALILGHCNITKNFIYEIVDYTNSELLETFGDVREDFFTGIGTLIVDQKEREEFYSKYLNAPSLRAYENGINEVVMSCYIQLPNQKSGKYVQFKVVLVETPDTGDVTGILTVTDITETTIREKIFMKLSSSNYDLVANLNLLEDTYEIVSGGDENFTELRGCSSKRIQDVMKKTVVETEQAYFMKMLNPENMLKQLEKKESYSFTYSIMNADGTLRAKNMMVAAVDLRLGRVCLIRADVTEVLLAERAAKEELERALEAAKKASRVKSDFLSSMSHDIRTPMNAIVGMTTLALANIENQEKIKEYLQKISVSSQHLLSLINDILDMSQIEQSKICLNQQPIWLEEMMNHIASIMEVQAENRGIHFQIERKEIRHSYFLGDMLRIKQILINLLSNAVKFTMEGGKILFRVEEKEAEQENYVRYRFTVKDTGIGMSREFQTRLFEPFIRSEKVAKVEGTGLGLSITKGLVDLMGGQIFVQSKSHEGTTFYIDLEFQKMEEIKKDRKETQVEGEKEDLFGSHFLLVEDNEINSEILGELLQMQGATYTIVMNGQQAVEEMERSEPGTYDAIFMDIQMLVMNGYEATKAIRKLDHPDAKSIVILAMTANAFAEDVHASLEAGMNGHIAKPVDMDLVYHTIEKLVKKK